MTTEPNSFLTVSSKEAALLYQTAANLQLQFLFRFYCYALQKSASCETKLGLLLSSCLNWKITAMITLHFHLQPQYKHELFHIYFT